MLSYLRSLLLFVALTVTALADTEAVPFSKNYTADLLRYAKGSEMKALLNEDKPPCQNFYKFACGKWSNLYPAPRSGKSSYLDRLDDLYWRKSADMLDSDDTKTDSDMDRKLKKFYKSCQQSGKLDQDGLDAILKAVNFAGGWPKVQRTDWYELDYDWLKVVATMRRQLGVDILIGLKIVTNFEDNETHRVMVGAPKLPLDIDTYLEDSEEKENLRQAYRMSIENQLQRYFPEMSEEWAFEVADQVVQVEKSLAKGFPLNRKLTEQQTTRQKYLADLKEAYGNYVDISRYLNIVFNDSIYLSIYETPHDYLPNLVEVISATPKLTIANYTMWKVLDRFEIERGSQKKSDKWCVKQIMEYFPGELKTMFKRNHNTLLVSNHVRSVWADIKKVFRDELQNLTWLKKDADTKQKAVEKLNAMEIEFEGQQENGAEITNNLTMRTNFYQNLINIWEWKTAQNLRKLLQKTTVAMQELMMPQYVYNRNVIVYPVKFMQYRFFWDDAYPHSLLYSTYGYLLAKEMLKGFDTMGRSYDKYGNLKKWWDTDSEYSFDHNAKCYLKQYGNYKFDKWSVKDENNLLNTYITDNGALRLSFKAYQQWWTNVANNKLAEQELLPLLETYSRNQIFFMAFAQLWCADYHQDIPKFEHLPEIWRVIGVLANSNDFAREYSCEIGNKMNPEQKCTILF